LPTLRTFLVGMLLLTPLPTRAQAGPPGIPRSTVVVTVNATVQELMVGYLRWVHRHPEVMRQALPPISGNSQVWQDPASRSDRVVDPLLIRMPSIDLYSRGGKSVHHGTSPQGNATFLRALPRSIPKGRAIHDESRPTLREAMGMLPELKPYESEFLKKKGYTVFALTYPGDPTRCKAQDEAVKQLEGRARRIGIRVIEVRLRK
jgi:hypothetical protein